MQHYTILQTLQRLGIYSEGATFKDLIQDSYEPADLYQDYLETKGDLNDIHQIIDQDIILRNLHPDQEGYLKHYTRVWNFINAAQFICRPEELELVPEIAEFKKGYPALYKTMCTWAWG